MKQMQKQVENMQRSTKNLPASQRDKKIRQYEQQRIKHIKKMHDSNMKRVKESVRKYEVGRSGDLKKIESEIVRLRKDIDSLSRR